MTLPLAEYKNHQHYIDEGWHNEPKEIFKFLIAQINNDFFNVNTDLNILDIGCATGELLYRINQCSLAPIGSLVGADIFDSLLNSARTNCPNMIFENMSALDIKEQYKNFFDIVIACGVMSIFDEHELGIFWKNLISSSKENGKIYVLSPLNEFGVDINLKHRKRVANKTKEWESGWNIYAMETINEILESCGYKAEYSKFQIPFQLEQKSDPIRTWTMPTPSNPYQLTNGLKLMVDHYLISAQKID